MDNVSHSLTGLALSRAGLNRLTPHAALMLILSANMPDIDIVALAKGQLAYFALHRGPTHSFLGVPVLAAECVILVAVILRTRLPWFRAWFVCCLGILSHLLLDWTNNYGIRPLIPFSPKWFHLDLNALTDGPFVAALVLIAVWPWISGLVSGEIGEAKKTTGQGFAIFVLLLCCAYEVGRFNFHSRAITQLESRIYDGNPPIQVDAMPTGMNPFRWRGIVTTKPSYFVYDVNIFSQLNTETSDRYFRIPTSEATAKLRKTPEFDFLLYFSRFPIWSIQPVALNDGSGKRIELTDLRFGTPGAGSFHAVGVVDPNDKVLASWFTFSSGANLGWTDPRSKY